MHTTGANGHSRQALGAVSHRCSAWYRICWGGVPSVQWHGIASATDDLLLMAPLPIADPQPGEVFVDNMCGSGELTKHELPHVCTHYA